MTTPGLLAAALRAAAPPRRPRPRPSSSRPCPDSRTLLALSVPEVPKALARAAPAVPERARRGRLRRGRRMDRRSSSAPASRRTVPAPPRRAAARDARAAHLRQRARPRRAASTPAIPNILWFTSRTLAEASSSRLYRLDRAHRPLRAPHRRQEPPRRAARRARRAPPRLERAPARNGKDTDVYVADVARPKEARADRRGRGHLSTRSTSRPAASSVLVDAASAPRRGGRPAASSNVATGERSRALRRGEGHASAPRRSPPTARRCSLVTDRCERVRTRSTASTSARAGTPSPSRTPRHCAGTWRTIAVAQDGSRGRVRRRTRTGQRSSTSLEPAHRGSSTACSCRAGVVTALVFPARSARRPVRSRCTAPRAPNDVFRRGRRIERRSTRWTRSEVGGLDTGDASPSRSSSAIRRPAACAMPGVPLPPPRRDSRGARPVVISWHGGPEGQSRPMFCAVHSSSSSNELGFAVLEPNVRGSDRVRQDATSRSTTGCRARRRSPTSARRSTSSRAREGLDSGPHRGLRRLVRRVHGARLADAPPDAHPRRRRASSASRPCRASSRTRRRTGATSGAPSTATSACRRCARSRSAISPLQPGRAHPSARALRRCRARTTRACPSRSPSRS